MQKVSAGLLLYRRNGGILEVFLVHPGGPFWKKKDMGAWSIPKGEPDPGEELLAAAQREFEEETGCMPSGDYITLSPVRQTGGKAVHAWALEGDCDPAAVRSNVFTVEWPPRSGRQQEFPEVDRAAWVGMADAKKKINQGQIALLDELARMLHEPEESISPQSAQRSQRKNEKLRL
jgi:predicted NUDIX family NTP pyrophosphohydrolase